MERLAAEHRDFQHKLTRAQALVQHLSDRIPCDCSRYGQEGKLERRITLLREIHADKIATIAALGEKLGLPPSANVWVVAQGPYPAAPPPPDPPEFDGTGVVVPEDICLNGAVVPEPLKFEDIEDAQRQVDLIDYEFRVLLVEIAELQWHVENPSAHSSPAEIELEALRACIIDQETRIAELRLAQETMDPG